VETEQPNIPAPDQHQQVDEEGLLEGLKGQQLVYLKDKKV